MTTLTVGAGQEFSTLAAAVAASQNGDVVAVQAGTYTNQFADVYNKAITIEGVGGQANFVATEAPSDGKAIIDTNGNVTLKNLTFSGAAVGDGNGAGVRYEAGNLTVDSCYFHDNQNGLLSSASPTGTISINNSQFIHNGTGTGYTHNIYVGEIAQLTVTNSLFQDSVAGHEIKSRAAANTITNNRIEDLTGNGSYLIDLPDGGVDTVTGNLLQKGVNAPNQTMIHFGGEGLPYANNSLTVTGNTAVNDRSFAYLVDNAANQPVSISGNSTWGLSASQLSEGAASIGSNTFLSSRPTVDATPILGGTNPNPPPNPPSDLITIGLSADTVNGSVQFCLSVDGQVRGSLYGITGGTSGTIHTYTFPGKFSAGPHQISITEINSKGAGNAAHVLDVHSVKFDGTELLSNVAAVGSFGSARLTTAAAGPAQIVDPAVSSSYAANYATAAAEAHQVIPALTGH